MNRLIREVRKGDKLTKEVTVEKVRKGNVTVLKIDDKRYILQHKDQFKG